MDDGVMTAYIHYLLVRPDCQGRGIGRQLLEKVKEKYKDYLRIALMAYNKKSKLYNRCLGGHKEALRACRGWLPDTPSLSLTREC